GLPGPSGVLRGSPGSGGPDGLGDAVGVNVRGHGQADDQGIAAHRAGPLLAVAVWHIGTTRGLRVELLEQPLLVTSGAVPAQLRHPGDLLGAMRHGPAGVEGVDADSGMLARRFAGSRTACLPATTVW